MTSNLNHHPLANKDNVINRDEEAGSILIALANQNGHHSNKICSTKKSMSIQNLLGVDRSKKKRQGVCGNRDLEKLHLSHNKSTEHLIREHYRCAGPSETPNHALYYHRSSTSENQSDGCSTPSTPPSYHPYLHKVHEPNFSMGDMVLDDRMLASNEPYFQHFPVQTSASKTNRSYRMYPSRMAKGRSMQQTQIQKQDKNLPPSSVQRSQEFTNSQHLQKQSPKLRFNALQAYISYMTYADMTRRRTHPASLIMTGPPLQTSPRNSIIEQPLTAFLHKPLISTSGTSLTKKRSN